MRLISRYILREFLVAFGYCLLAFVVLRLVFEMFDTLREFLAYGTPPTVIAQYYLLTLPGAVAVSTPVSVFFGLLFALVTMSKNSELIAMRAAGQSLPRACVATVLACVAVAAGVFSLNELLVPASNERAGEMHERERLLRKVEKGKMDATALTVIKNLTYVNHRERRTWRFGSFNPKTLSGEDVIIEWQPAGQPELSVHARFAYWVYDHWLFQKVRVIRYTTGATGNAGVPQEYFETWEPPGLNDLPEDMELFQKKEPDFMTLPQLKRYLVLHPKEELAEIRFNLHRRFAYPWTCVVACLIAIPLGAGTGRRSPLVGVAMALTLFATFLFINYFTATFGKTGKLDAVLAAWLANGIFTLFAVLMIWRAR
ncbi:MAG: LptF/LptG family permease [Verrucomicrobia bacterium]|nr:LptF/LptG family permease [Verrucomicrobiota bacterium]